MKLITKLTLVAFLVMAHANVTLAQSGYDSGNPFDRETYRQSDNPFDRETYRQGSYGCD